MEYRLRLDIRYRFQRPAGGGRQIVRVMPAALPGRQIVTSCRLNIHPAPLEKHPFTDFFGTDAVEVVLPAGLRDLSVIMAAEVNRLPAPPGPDLSPPLSALAAELAAVQDVSADSPHHFLPPSPRIPEVAEIGAFALAATAGTASTVEVIRAFGLALHDTMIFDAAATEVDTPVDRAFAGRKGVCQDFAQIMIAGLRHLGIPAAYVAGYLRTLPPPGKPRLQGADAMHAWVRAWAGAETGWIEYDPTNACRVDTDHIVVGYGRDYGDVAPVTGSLRLEGGQQGSHSVDIAEA